MLVGLCLLRYTYIVCLGGKKYKNENNKRLSLEPACSGVQVEFCTNPAGSPAVFPFSQETEPH